MQYLFSMGVNRGEKIRSNHITFCATNSNLSNSVVVKIVAHEDGLDWYLRFSPDPEDPVKCHVDGNKRKGGKTPTFAYGSPLYRKEKAPSQGSSSRRRFLILFSDFFERTQFDIVDRLPGTRQMACNFCR